MQNDIYLLEKLSSRSILDRKKAIKDLTKFNPNSYLTRLSLHYVSIHDPCYTVRNIARQAYSRLGADQNKCVVWDKSYLF